MLIINNIFSNKKLEIYKLKFKIKQKDNFYLKPLKNLFKDNCNSINIEILYNFNNNFELWNSLL